MYLSFSFFSECSQIDEVEKSAHMEADKPGTYILISCV